MRLVRLQAKKCSFNQVSYFKTNRGKKIRCFVSAGHRLVEQSNS